MNMQRFIELALEEDVGREDVTSISIIPSHLHGEARIFAKSSLVVCGHTPARMVFEAMGCTYHPQIEEGNVANFGDNIALVRGPYRNLLTAERLALNFLMKLCGIATQSSELLIQERQLLCFEKWKGMQFVLGEGIITVLPYMMES